MSGLLVIYLFALAVAGIISLKCNTVIPILFMFVVYLIFLIIYIGGQ